MAGALTAGRNSITRAERTFQNTESPCQGDIVVPAPQIQEAEADGIEKISTQICSLMKILLPQLLGEKLGKGITRGTETFNNAIQPPGLANINGIL